jgi:hypothetical protein
MQPNKGKVLAATAPPAPGLGDLMKTPEAKSGRQTLKRIVHKVKPAVALASSAGAADIQSL